MYNDYILLVCLIILTVSCLMYLLPITDYLTLNVNFNVLKCSQTFFLHTT